MQIDSYSEILEKISIKNEEEDYKNSETISKS